MKKIENYNLFLDDYRHPNGAYSYTRQPIYSDNRNWIVVRNYHAFISLIQTKGIPETISFDHDLGGDIEIWKNINNYEGIYSVSSLGRVMRLKKSRRTQGNNILTPNKSESGLYVTLRNNGNDRRCYIHRLVGEAFFKNPNNKPEINHKDGNRWNNNVDNLEWVTSSENNLHSHLELDRKFTAYGENHRNSITVSQYNKLGELLNVYGSVNEAGRQLKIQFTNIAKCARGERKTAGGFIWKYENKIPTVKTNINFIKKEDRDYTKRFFIPETFTEKTGYHCAKWLIDYCIDNKLDIPNYIMIHSMNPVGSMNIRSLFDTYCKVMNIPFKPIYIFCQIKM